MNHRLVWGVLAATLLAPEAARPQTGGIPADLDRVVESAMEAFSVPGIGLAVVKDGDVLLAKGYGVRELGVSAAVDDRTLFGIASNSKAFTATGLALLEEEGRLEWDGPVIRYLPWFRLSDPYVTHELTIRDLLVHRSGLGLGAGDLLWWPPTTYDRREVAERLRFIPLATSFRSAYAYDNVLYLVAGEVIAAVSGKEWEDFVASRILGPVGMADSDPWNERYLEAANVAMPHARVEGIVQPIKPYESDNVNPAGGINASARDMARWLVVQLDSGRVAGAERLFSARTAEELWTIVTPMPNPAPEPELSAARSSFMGYGLGFRIRDYRGRKVVSHTGGLPGLFSRVTMLPDEKLGVVVLTNQEERDAHAAITNHILDHFLGADDTDWVAAHGAARVRALASMAEVERAAEAARDSTSGPSLPLESYAGTYRDAWYGDVEIEGSAHGLTIRLTRSPDLVGDLRHWQHDTFLARWWDRDLRADAFVTFALMPDGSIDQVRLRPASPAVDFSYDFQDLLLRPLPPSGAR